MNHISSATIAVAFAVTIFGGPARAGDAPSCKELITEDMVKSICGATMRMSTRGKDEPKRCYDKLTNINMEDGNVLYFTVKNFPDEAKAIKEYERWKKATLSNATPEKVAAKKAEGSLYIESVTDITSIGDAAYEQKMFTPDTGQSRIKLDILTGHHNIEINSDMWIMGKTLPCDSAQLQAIAKEVVKKLGH